MFHKTFSKKMKRRRKKRILTGEFIVVSRLLQRNVLPIRQYLVPVKFDQLNFKAK
jgi:hypothetical protein